MKRWIFLNTEKLDEKRAVERNLEIIGEAINRILKTDKVHIKITDANRNRWIEKPGYSCL
jgi:uncharacterized protein with HEPN domain